MLHAKVLIFDATAQVGLYEWEHIQRGGPLTVADGRAYRWASEFTSRGMLSRSFDESSQWWLWDSQQRAILGGRLERSTLTISLHPEAADVPELGLLAGFAAYLVLRWWDTQSARDRD